MISGCFIFWTYKFDFFTGAFGCYKCVVTQNGSFDLATALTSEIYKPRLIDDPLCSLGA